MGCALPKAAMRARIARAVAWSAPSVCFPRGERALQQRDRPGRIAARRAGLRELLRRDHDGHVIRCEHLLANARARL